MMLREDGIIIGTSADTAWALQAMGVDPVKIIHHNLAQFVDVFADVGKSPASGRLTPTLVTGAHLVILHINPSGHNSAKQLRSCSKSAWIIASDDVPACNPVKVKYAWRHHGM